MDTIFWLGLVIGAILSLVASVVANIYHERISAFLESRKLASQSNRFQSAYRFHKLITELHSGKRDKYLYMVRLAAGMVISMIFVFVCLSTGTIATLLATHATSSDSLLFKTFKAEFVYEILFLLGSVIMMVTYMKEARRYRDITNALSEFDAFDAAFKTKWNSHL